MSRAARAVTIVIQPDGATWSQTYRVPVWMLRAGVGFMAAAAVAAVVVAALYGPLLRSAARVPGLERKVERLEADNAKVRQLSAALDSVESRYAQVRQMIGGDIVRDPLTVGTSLPVAPAVLARVADAPRGPAAGRARLYHARPGRYRLQGRGTSGHRYRRCHREPRPRGRWRDCPPAGRGSRVRLLRAARPPR